MGERSMDRMLAAAESRLDRLDDDSAEATDSTGEVDLASDGLHIELSGVQPDELVRADDDGLDGGGPDGELIGCVDAFNEAFNARDLDGLLDVLHVDCEAPGLGNDMDNLPDAVEDLWERRPSCVLTRGELDDDAVAVAWELDDEAGWWPVAVLFFAGVTDGQIGVLEYGEGPDDLERVIADPPDGDVDEGSRWREWDEGAPAD